MADRAIVRLVDDQRSQIRWLANQAATLNGDAQGTHALVCASARALHVCLTAYFAELTQPRFDRALWPKLLACQASFVAMACLANSPSQMLTEWLDAELSHDASLPIAIKLIAIGNEPAASGYRSGLLSSTSLEADSGNLIASSAAAPLKLTFDVLMPVVAELEAAIERQRAQNLEC